MHAWDFHQDKKAPHLFRSSFFHMIYKRVQTQTQRQVRKIEVREREEGCSESEEEGS